MSSLLLYLTCHSSLVQDARRSGLTPQDMPLGNRGIYLYIYLAYTCNVFYEKREYSARYALILRASELQFKRRTCARNARRARWYRKRAAWA